MWKHLSKKKKFNPFRTVRFKTLFLFCSPIDYSTNLICIYFKERPCGNRYKQKEESSLKLTNLYRCLLIENSVEVFLH